MKNNLKLTCVCHAADNELFVENQPSSMIPATGSRRIVQERCGKVAGNRWNMEAVFRPEIVRIFSGGFLCFQAGTDRKSSEKAENFPAGILLPQNYRNYQEPVVFGPVCSTWEVIQKFLKSHHYLVFLVL